jgi:hypothetical protein
MSKKPGAKAQPAAGRRARGRPFFLQKIRRRDIILLIGLTAFACFSLITVGLLILRYSSTEVEATAPANQPRPIPTHVIPYTQVTGLGQFKPAQAEALAWAEDALLVSASANWPGVTSMEQVGQPGPWTYRFYSPAKQRLFISRVTPDNQVHSIEHVVPVTLPPQTLDTGTWLIDSPAALGYWLDLGGAEMLRTNPGLELLIQLRSVGSQPQPVWMVVGSDDRTQDIHIVVVDAGEGFIVPVAE